MLLLLLAVTPAADPPKRLPVALPPRVLPVATTADGYADCLAAVDRGETVYLAVGVAAEKGDYSCSETPMKSAPGRYKCWKLPDGRPWMEPVDAKATAAPAADSHSDHQCPKCGTMVWVQSGQRPDGSHTHTCPHCGSSWSHGGALGYPGTRDTSPQSAYSPRYTLPGSGGGCGPGGCPSGGCPTPSYQPFGFGRRGW